MEKSKTVTDAGRSIQSVTIIIKVANFKFFVFVGVWDQIQGLAQGNFNFMWKLCRCHIFHMC